MSTATGTPASPIADVSSSSNSRDQTLVIRQVTPDIITFSIPFTRSGMVPIGGRGTAIKLPSSEIMLYVSTPHTPATAETIAKFGGEVKWLVTPDGEHDMYIQEYAQAYPNAQPIGIKRAQENKPDVKWAGVFGAGGENKQYGFEPHVSLHHVSSFVNDELVAIHHPSGTLLEADMLFNLPPNEQYSRNGGIPGLMKMFGSGRTMSPGGVVHGLAADALTKDKELMKKELAPIMAAKWDRIIPCHGDVIESGGRADWEKVWHKYT